MVTPQPSSGRLGTGTNSDPSRPDHHLGPTRERLIPGWADYVQHNPAWAGQPTYTPMSSIHAPLNQAQQPAQIMAGYPSWTTSASSRPITTENTLRRKTPNGVLHGAFQSSLHPSLPPKQPMAFHGSIVSSFPASIHQSSYDSIIYQGQAQPFHYVNPLIQGGVTVIQPTGHLYGPTASSPNGKGPYGPYWQDGTFVPYRPNAIRDPRFYPPLTQQMGPPIGMRQPHAPMGTDASIMRSQHFGRPVVGAPSPEASAYRHYGAAINAYPSLALPQSPAALSFIEPLAEFDAASANAQDRERIFTLALHTYRELLDFLEQVRKTNSQIQHGHANTRPGIYPKPPSSSTGHSPVLTPEGQTAGGAHIWATLAGERPQTLDYFRNNAWVADHPPDPRSVEAVSGQTPRSNDASNRVTPPRPRYHADHKPSWSHAQHQSLDRLQTITRPSSSSAATAAAQYASQNTAVPRAKNALSSLDLLCQYTGWQWIDGLNLSGCLAYGLGDHQKALELYNRVLSLDPKHIEAIANLAATLLALGRKQEAEQLWTKAVKQAPSYFEAVEHLVGLLCSSGRGKDAVKVIEFVERELRIIPKAFKAVDSQSDASSMACRSPCASEWSDLITSDYDTDGDSQMHTFRKDSGAAEPGFGSSGYSIPGAENGRMLALVHAKGNMLYSQGDNSGAARALEDVVLIATGRKFQSVKAVVRHVLNVVAAGHSEHNIPASPVDSADPILLYPDQALVVAKLCFPDQGELPGLAWLSTDTTTPARNSAILTTSNSLLSLAKIFQDGMSTNTCGPQICQLISGVREILALYYLSLALQPSPSTANNVGILLAGIQQSAAPAQKSHKRASIDQVVPNVVEGSGIHLALSYYNHGLVLDARHAHLYTNLGSLLKDIGQLDAAIDMYKQAVHCDGRFDIALANLANAVKDKGRISEAITYYNRAVEVNPDFAEAVCGLANALNSVCRWKGRGGIALDNGTYDRWHVDDRGMLIDPTQPGVESSGWVKRVVDIVEKQLSEGEDWGIGTLTASTIQGLVGQVIALEDDYAEDKEKSDSIRKTLVSWSGQKYEGARLVRFVERLNRRVTWRYYQDKYVKKRERVLSFYQRPQLPSDLTIPPAPTVLPFHAFTSPLSARQVRLISQRNGYRISASTLKAPWLGTSSFPPPAPPSPALKIGYVSSDFNNHPLAHLMQSVFGLHDPSRVEAYCYATTAGDNSVHRQQIEAEAPYFYDASTWSTEKLVRQIIDDGIHILVNLNGYTRGARNEVFAARPAPIQMSFMGFAGTLGAEWCDYLFADSTSIPASTLRPWRRNVDITDQLLDNNSSSPSSVSSTAENVAATDNVDDDNDRWVYGENIIFSRSTFFCCDHRQSAPDSAAGAEVHRRIPWSEELAARLAARKQLFPALSPDTVILANFNQLYKIDPSTFRSWLRILSRCPRAILWLLRFPDAGEADLLRTAAAWAGPEVASRVLFTDVAPKDAHIARAKIVDLFLDTPECNAHTTAADVLWSATPLLTWPRYDHKMCSRMAASILRGALTGLEEGGERRRAEEELIAVSEADYEAKAIRLALGMRYATREEIEAGGVEEGHGRGRLMELRRALTRARWKSALFDTRRWVAELEDACEEVWRRWVAGEGGDVWMDEVKKGSRK